jgi:hypothetical protein
VALLAGMLRPDGADADARHEREVATQVLASLGRPAAAGLIRALEVDYAGGDPKTEEGAARAEARLAVIALLEGIGSKEPLPEAELALAQLEGRERAENVKIAAKAARLKIGLRSRGGKDTSELKP